MNPPKKRRDPNTLLILFCVAVLFALIIPFVPAGSFLVDAPISLQSFRYDTSASKLTLFSYGENRGFLNFLFEGFTSGGRNGAAVGVIALVLIIGGAFAVINATGSIDRGLKKLVAKTGHRPSLLLASLFFAFSLGGAVFGMGEETIAFLALLLPLIDRLGVPRFCAVMATYMASQIGFATSWMNPFSVVIAQGIAQLPPLSGAPFRMAMWATFTAVGAAFTVYYARKHRLEPQVSSDTADTADSADAVSVDARMNWADHSIFLLVVATVVWIIWGVMAKGYYLAEIATQFFTLGLAVGIVACFDRRLTANGVADTFIDGARQMVPVAMVIAAAKGLVWLLGGADVHQPSVLNTLLYAMGNGLNGWPEHAAAQGMLVTQLVFNVFITSGSAQAAVTMPLMSGLSDLVNVSRQVAVLAFQLGDGLTHLVIPTSAVMMGAIGVAGLSWSEWVRWIWRFELLMIALASGFVALAVAIGYV
jgi:uncharacterized ion transporter superfamily protein YfcC